MENIITIETKTTPNVIFDNGLLTIVGKSIPFESELYWSLVLHQIKKINNIETLKIELSYINTDSIRHILNIIKSFDFEVVWSCDYSDDDMIELGKNLEELSNKEFKFLNSKIDNHILNI